MVFTDTSSQEDDNVDGPKVLTPFDHSAMLSPFPTSSPVLGNGKVHLTLLTPSTPSFSTLDFTYPLKLIPSNPHILRPIEPSAESQNLAERSLNLMETNTHIRPATVPLLFLLTYGGGLLPIDRIHLSIALDAHTRLTIATQGSTKIYKSTPATASTSGNIQAEPSTATNLTSTQTLHCTLYSHSSLCYFPHPIQPFASSRYAQVQTFDLHDGASLGLLDWVSEGRRARGESWDFEAWRGRNEVWTVRRQTEGSKQTRKLLIRDSVVLQGKGINRRMEGLGIFGTLILVGPMFQSLADYFITEFAALPRIGGRNWDPEKAIQKLTSRETWRTERQKLERSNGVTWTAAGVRHGRATVVKFGARNVEGAREWLRAMLQEEGGLVKEFGEGAMMGVG